jgi:hypothetical protein
MSIANKFVDSVPKGLAEVIANGGDRIASELAKDVNTIRKPIQC